MFRIDYYYDPLLQQTFSVAVHLLSDAVGSFSCISIFYIFLFFFVVFYFQAPCQAELDTWVNSIHSACAAAFARHRGKTGTLHLLQEEILRLERSIESVCVDIVFHHILLLLSTTPHVCHFHTGIINTDTHPKKKKKEMECFFINISFRASTEPALFQIYYSNFFFFCFGLCVAFCLLIGSQIKTHGRITIVGRVRVGESTTNWCSDRSLGREFGTTSLRTVPPSMLHGQFAARRTA